MPSKREEKMVSAKPKTTVKRNKTKRRVLNSNSKPRKLSFEANKSVSESVCSEENGTSHLESLLDPDSSGYVECLLKKQWKLFRSSPLSDFIDSKIKIYEKKLSEALASLNFSSTKTYRCRMSVVPDLKASTAATSGIKICVEEKNIASKGYWKTCYLSYWLSWALEDVEADPSSLSHRPLLLVSASKHIAGQVHGVLCKFFDCDISSFQLSQQDLAKILCINLEQAQGVVDDESLLMTLVFDLPPLPSKNKVSLTFNYTDAYTTLFILRRDVPDQIDAYQLFFQHLLVFVFTIYKIDVTKALFTRLRMPHITINNNGEVTWRSSPAAQDSLAFLHKVSVLLESSRPSTIF